MARRSDTPPTKKGSGRPPKPRYSPAELFVAVVGIAFLVLLAGLVVTSLME